MAVSFKITTARRKQVADLLGGEKLPLASPSSDSVQPALRESFQIFTAATEDVQEYVRLAEACRATNAWHHQIEVSGQVTLFATTRRAEAEGERILGTFRNALARQIDAAISSIDNAFPEDIVSVKLVVLLGTHIYFFLLIRDREEQVFIISSSFSELGFTEGRTLSAADFRDLVSKLPTKIGIDFA